MIDKDFFIYTDRNKLQTPSNTEYRIKKLLDIHELKPSIKACKEELNTKGAKAVFKNFDKLFSVIEHVKQLDFKTLHYVFDEILVKSLNIIGSFFSSYGNIEDIEPDDRHTFTNVIKMTIYLFIEFVHSFNAKIEVDYKLILLETKGRNKKQDMILKHTSDYNWNWEDKMCEGFEGINSIISYDITQLYDPPYIDHTFVLYIASCCYTQLENPSIAFVRTKQLRDSIMQILVTLITNYDLANNFKTKVVQLLKLYEHLSLPLAKTVLQIVESGNNRESLIELIVKEIAETGEMEGLKESSNQEVTGGKSCCAFLVEIAKCRPQIVLPNIKHLLPCLDNDPYTMRICVLSVLKELIINVLNSDELSEIDQKIRDDYLCVIQDHSLDVNAFVRSKALQLLTSIVNENCLPKKMYREILNCAEEKLHDKSSYVTKSAIQLIKILMKLNPYSCNFSENELQVNLRDEKNNLKNMEQVLVEKMYGKMNKEETWLSIEPLLKSFLDETFEIDTLELCEKPEIIQDIKISDVIMMIKNCIALHKFKLAVKLIVDGKETFKNEPLLNFRIQDENNLIEKFFLLFKNIWWYESTDQSKVPNNIENVEQMTVEELGLKISLAESKIEYLQECAEYLGTIKKCLSNISQLLFGNTTSESLEAIDFFTTAYQFRVHHAEVGVDAMLTLIHSSDINIKEAMMNSYKTIYLNVEDNIDATSRVTTIMTKLIHLVKTLSVINRNAFKVLLHEWIKNNTLDEDCVMILWAWFTKSIKISHENRVAATLLLSLIASAKPSIVKGNLDSLIHYGLCEDYDLFIYTCQILEKMTIEDFKRFPVNHEMVNRILNVTQNYFYKCDGKIFQDVALNAINIIYKLTAEPDETCMILIRKFSDFIQEKQMDLKQEKASIELIYSSLAKLIFIIGHVAYQQYNHLENHVSKVLILEVRKKYQLKKSEMDKHKEDENVHDNEAAEIEAINERIRHVCDKKIVYGHDGCLSLFSKIILKTCHLNHTALKTNGIVALIKYMLVSTSFCKKHLPLFLNLIENSDNFGMTIDLVTGFGWLVFRHPNLMEPHTDKLYARLNDKRCHVRYSTLVTIIDLIRQEMVKVRSQVAGIAKLLVDENEKIKHTAKQFFAVIAEKGNTLYNVLSDIISILSNPEDLVPESDFQAIMKYLLSLITKERQIESLVDKLCIRLKESSNDVQAYYISYCLMIIKYTDKSLTKLCDNINYYTDKLKNPKVYNNFNILISTNSRMMKPSTKNIIAELSSKIEKIGMDEDFSVATFSQKLPVKRLTTIKKKPPKSTVKVSPGGTEPLQEVVTKRSARCRTQVKRRLIIDSEEGENNSEDSNIPMLVDIKSNTNCEIDDDTVTVFKKNTRQNNSESTSKRKLRQKSNKL